MLKTHRLSAIFYPWFVISIFVACALIIATLIAFPQVTYTGLITASKGNDLFVIVGLSLMFSAAIITLSALGIIGLILNKETVRSIAIILAGAECFWFPIGTVIGILVLIKLVSRDFVDSSIKNP